MLLTRDKRPKIGDVGFAKAVRATAGSMSGTLGTFAWAAPELLLGEPCDESADMFSFGVILWELCTGQQPVRGAMAHIGYVVCMQPPNPGVCVVCHVPSLREDAAPEQIRTLIKACRNPNPRLRPTAKDAVTIIENTIFQSAHVIDRVQSDILPRQATWHTEDPHHKLPPLFTVPPNGDNHYDM